MIYDRSMGIDDVKPGLPFFIAKLGENEASISGIFTSYPYMKADQIRKSPFANAIVDGLETVISLSDCGITIFWNSLGWNDKAFAIIDRPEERSHLSEWLKRNNYKNALSYCNYEYVKAI